MDPILLIAVSLIIAILIVLIALLKKSQLKSNDKIDTSGEQIQNIPGPGARRRNVRRRIVERDDEGGENLSEDSDSLLLNLPDGKIGAKKLRKLQEKEERRKQREYELSEREEKKKRDEEIEKRRREKEEIEKLKELEIEEQERRLKEEQDKKEHEEYLKLKVAFTVEEEGVSVLESENSDSLLQEFIDYITQVKVVMLEDLASHFKIRTQDCIDRIKTLQSEGRLTGVLDDRGKFIYITLEELHMVADFIQKRGRVSITELAECSNRLISLNPEVEALKNRMISQDSK